MTSAQETGELRFLNRDAVELLNEGVLEQWDTEALERMSGQELSSIRWELPYLLETDYQKSLSEKVAGLLREKVTRLMGRVSGEKHRRDSGTWNSMAIEKQFRPLVDTGWDYPATLAYLEQQIEDFHGTPGARRAEMVRDYLLAHLTHGQYAIALMNVLWGESELTWDEMMEETLYSPESLMSEAEVFGYTLMGM